MRPGLENLFSIIDFGKPAVAIQVVGTRTNYEATGVYFSYPIKMRHNYCRLVRQILSTLEQTRTCVPHMLNFVTAYWQFNYRLITAFLPTILS